MPPLIASGAGTARAYAARRCKPTGRKHFSTKWKLAKVARKYAANNEVNYIAKAVAKCWGSRVEKRNATGERVETPAEAKRKNLSRQVATRPAYQASLKHGYALLENS